MKDSDWTILKEIDHYRNITKAAAALFLTQPSLSKRIQNIEQELNVQILIRNRSGIEFTEAGKYLVECAKKQDEFMESVHRRLEYFRKDQRGVLCIGTSYSFAHFQLSSIFQEYKKYYENIEAEIVCLKSDKLVHMLEMEQIHVAFIRGDYQGDFEKYQICAEEGYIVSWQELDLARLPEYPAITYSTGEYTTRQFSNWWRANFKKEQNCAVTAAFVDSAWKMVRDGFGYTISFMTKEQADELRSEGAYLYPMLDLNNNPVLRPTFFIYRDEDTYPAYLKDFIDLVLNMKMMK